MSDAVARAYRTEWARVLATTAQLTRDLDLAEECTQEAFARALRVWPSTGVPDRPGAWLTQVARNAALDDLRRRALLRERLPLLVTDEQAPEPDADRLRLIFTCCHPALSREAQAALTLRLVCGLTTAEVARAFLTSEATMAARITRAKKKIAAARIPYRTPAPEDLGERVGVVLEVVQLIFATGHTAPSGPRLMRADLLDRALDLGRMLRLLMPADADVAAQLALMLLIDARSAGRVAADGRMLLLEEQDRSRWDADRIREGVALLVESLRRGRPGRYALQAAIAAVHAESPSWAATDWTALVDLYDRLAEVWPTAVVRLNRAVAVGLRDGPQAGLDALASLPALGAYPYLSAARADFLRRLGRREEALAAYREALALTGNETERRFLSDRVSRMSDEQIPVLEALHSTPARRYLSSEPISDDILRALLDAAIRGPNGGNTQRWAWIVLRDPAVKAQIAAFYREGWESSYGKHRDAILSGPDTPGGFSKANFRAGDHLAAHLEQAPVWIFPVLLGAAKSANPRLGSSIYGAVQQLMLAARAYGIGSTLTTLHSGHEAETRELLGLPDDALTMALIPLGYPSKGRWAQPKRRPLDEVVFFDKFQTP
jgi:RNA polymerase sigma factor (sigma-70 family)